MKHCDRYVLKRSFFALVVVIVLVVSLVVGMDAVLNINMFLRGNTTEGSELWQLIASFYLYALPGLVSPLLPIAFALALVITCAPMLKRGEFIALTASGVSLRRATQGLMILAIAVGCLDVYLSDRLAPRFETERSIIEDQIRSRVRSARTWQVSDPPSQWYANSVTLRDDQAPAIHGVVVVTEHSLVHAHSLIYHDNGWRLQGPILQWTINSDGTDLLQSPAYIECREEFSLPYSISQLEQLFISRQALTGDELWRQGGALNLSLLASRWVRLFLPLLMALYILPTFVRFVNRDRLVVSALQGLALGILPLGIVTAATLSADASGLPPLLYVGTALIIASFPGIWLMRRWHL